MGYDLNITRAEQDWDNEDTNPITAEEWLQVVATDETLKVQGNDNNEYIVTDWASHGDSLVGAQFDWHHGRISAKYPSSATYMKMLELAHRLGGRVLGDDGEIYLQPRDYTPIQR
jgi:hypothetical protein